MNLTKTKAAVSTTLQWLRDGQPQANAEDDPKHILDTVIHQLACAYLEYSFRRRLLHIDATYNEAQAMKNLLTPQWDAEWESMVLQSIRHIIDCDKRIQKKSDDLT
jgi:hypothetical protein